MKCGIRVKRLVTLSTQIGYLAHASELEPVRTAVFSVKEGFTVSETAGDAASALGRVGAVEERDVLVADITEPRGMGVSAALVKHRKVVVTNQ